MSQASHNGNTVIVFGAHPDDIEIGMAGTICRLAACGNQVYSCIASIPDDREARLKEAEAAARILGIKDVIVLPVKASQLGYNRQSIGAVDKVIQQLRPHSVFTHWIEDSHQDHVNVTRCIIAATRKNNFNVYMYEQTIPGGITPAAFRAQYLIDVSRYIEQKMASIQAHASQLKRNGSWWSEGVRGRAMYRGYQIHTQFAEAFEIIKVNGDTNLFTGESESARSLAAEKMIENEAIALCLADS
ncbi:MAG TPA: PIG-L family deacetylase [Azospira sp.]|nr:PIG-L family deacetylase [Azospira sp.]